MGPKTGARVEGRLDELCSSQSSRLARPAMRCLCLAARAAHPAKCGGGEDEVRRCFGALLVGFCFLFCWFGFWCCCVFCFCVRFAVLLLFALVLRRFGCGIQYCSLQAMTGLLGFCRSQTAGRTFWGTNWKGQGCGEGELRGATDNRFPLEAIMHSCAASTCGIFMLIVFNRSTRMPNSKKFTTTSTERSMRSIVFH